MISNDSPAITLDETDQKKIGLVQNRLTVLQQEVLEATKNLAAIEDAIAQGQKNKEYYDEIIEGMKPEVDSLEKRKEALKQEITNSEDELRKHIDSHAELNVHFDSRKKEHDNREEALTSLQQEHSVKDKEFAAKHHSLSVREEKIVKAESVLRNALESLT